MRRRPNPLLPLFFVVASTGAACQLVNGIGDELTYRAGDGGGAQDAPVDQTVPQSDSGDAGVTGDADATVARDSAKADDADAADALDALDSANDADASNALDGANDADASDALDGANDADADVSDAHDAAACPTTGSPMVLITTLSGWSYCIDVTEVTLDQLSVYTASFPTMGPGVPAACKTDAALAQHVQPTNQPGSYPASGVNFCYAWDYCDRIGKRLCGNIGGGPVTSTASSEWYYACSNGSPPTVYPYGDTFDPSACVTDASGPTSVGSHAACHGAKPPFTQIFDMGGNLAELDQTASSLDGSEAAPVVSARGGSWVGTDVDKSCGAAIQFAMYTTATSDPSDFGFRCCATPH